MLSMFCQSTLIHIAYDILTQYAFNAKEDNFKCGWLESTYNAILYHGKQPYSLVSVSNLNYTGNLIWAYIQKLHPVFVGLS